MFYVYVLRSEKNRELYIGYTSNLKNRLQEHNQGLNLSTKRYVPWRLIYYEASIEEKDAVRREKYLKTTQGGRLLRRRLKEFLYKNPPEI
ncbi:MAG: GIY-YIG nuclease family protein [Candidatus Pacebacteria bacterium]|nr:GIY-YIG nuclease family protein [Candidatus Paceibacterota bacterium]